MQASVEEKKEPKGAESKKRFKGAEGGFLSRYKMLFGGSLAVAIAVHLLLLIGFGSYTLFKGSSSRMPFTSEGGVPAEEKFLSKLASRNNGKFMRICRTHQVVFWG